MPLKKKLSLNSRYYIAAILVDIVTVAFSLALAVIIRFGHMPVFPIAEFLGTAAFFMLGYFIASTVENLYSVRTTLNRPQESPPLAE